MEKPNNIKLQQLEKRYQNIKQDIEKLNNQLNHTENARTKNNLEREMNSLYEELEKIDQETKGLKSSIKKNDRFSAKRSFLSYLANRSSQEFELTEAIKNRDKSRLLVCIIHGDELQSHYKFLERMQNDFLPHVLDLDQNKTTVKIKK
ncbi:hypothetical protein [Dolichospermum heterosporum]|uniref:Uncharacterized protein n=1 Tax=Dolichospermum heterosporum TAC447 TaxID=747523 RepID=A0ABY5LS53_9CYAN|nr:hypothetical protein [Dolichospermum heterosporum]UUO13849.1 hypothetical protein NG743_17530 [Dolichospermum heterosporum TAC447]